MKLICSELNFNEFELLILRPAFGCGGFAVEEVKTQRRPEACKGTVSSPQEEGTTMQQSQGK